MRNRNRRNFGFTVLETVVAAGLFSVAAGIATQGLSSARLTEKVESRVNALHDARSSFLNLVAELQRSRQIAKPATFATDSSLEFFNERHERVRYELRDGKAGTQGRELVRRAGAGPERVIASGLKEATFHRGGRHLVSVSLRFAPTGREKNPRQFGTTLALRNRVF